MLRVLHVVTYMGRGGLETTIMNYYRKIDRSKIQFDFLVHRAFDGDFDDEIRELGGRIFVLPPLNPFSQQYRRHLTNFFKNHPYQIVHSHLDWLSFLPLRAAEKNQVPVRIAHSHNSQQDKNFKYLIKRWYKQKLPQAATHLFACGQKAGELSFDKQPFIIMPNALDLARFEPNDSARQKLRESWQVTEEIVIGHIGRLTPQKNHQFLLQLFANILKNQSAKLILVGTGVLEKKIRAQAEELGITKQILFLGNRQDVPQLLQAFDCFLLPSLYEGLPVVLLEAQAVGLPCIVSDEISAECFVTNLVTPISLDAPINVWQAAVNANLRQLKKTQRESLQLAGYDSAEAAKKLQKFYLDVMTNEEAVDYSIHPNL